eukprot:UN2199
MVADASASASRHRRHAVDDATSLPVVTRHRRVCEHGVEARQLEQHERRRQQRVEHPREKKCPVVVPVGDGVRHALAGIQPREVPSTLVDLDAVVPAELVSEQDGILVGLLHIGVSHGKEPEDDCAYEHADQVIQEQLAKVASI